MSTMVYQITSLTIVHSTVYSGADERKHQSSASLAFVRGTHRWEVNFPHKAPVTRKMFPFDDIIMGDRMFCLFLGFFYIRTSTTSAVGTKYAFLETCSWLLSDKTRIHSYTKQAQKPQITRLNFFKLKIWKVYCDRVLRNACTYSCVQRRRSKKTSKLRVTGLCAGNSPVTGDFPAQIASNAENVPIWWRHHAI